MNQDAHSHEASPDSGFESQVTQMYGLERGLGIELLEFAEELRVGVWSCGDQGASCTNTTFHRVVSFLLDHRRTLQSKSHFQILLMRCDEVACRRNRQTVWSTYDCRAALMSQKHHLLLSTP